MCTFALSEGRNPWVKNAFLALSFLSKSGKFQTTEGWRQYNAHSVCISPCTAHAVPHKVYTTAWGICFSVHFCCGFFQSLIKDERDKSLRFSCII